MQSDIEQLLESLRGLNDTELNKYKDVFRGHLPFHRHSLIIELMLRGTPSLQDIVFLTVQTFGQQAVVKTKEFLEQIRRSDQVQRWWHSRSGRKSKTVK